METSGNRTALGVTADIAQQVGARLRRARESIGRSTSALSAKIKVREHYLVAIEDGEWNELPPGLNGRGLIRIYARELSVAVPELDQAANQSVMPAEQDAQAPYQLNGSRKEGQWDREATTVRVAVENQPAAQTSSRPVDTVVKTNTLNSATRPTRGTENLNGSTRMSAPSAIGHRIIESTPDEEPLDVVTPDVASILGISLDVINEPAPQEKKRPLNMVSSQGVLPREDHVLHANMIIPEASEESKKSRVPFTPPVEVVQTVEVAPPVEVAPFVEVAPQVELTSTSAATVTEPAHHENISTSSPVVNESQTVTQNPETARSANPQGNGKKNKKHGKGRHDRAERTEETQHQSQSSAQPNNEPVAATEFVHSESPKVEKFETVVATDASSLQIETASASSSAEMNSQEAVEVASAQSVGVSAAEQYLMSHAQTAAPATDASFGDSQSQTSSNGKGLRMAVGLMAACVLVLVGGKFMMREPGQSSQADGNATESTAVDASQVAPAGTTQEAAAPAKTDATGGAASSAQTTPPTEPAKTDSASQQPVGAQTNAASAVSQPSTPGKVDSAPTVQAATVNAQPATSAANASNPTADEETAADNEETAPQKTATKPATIGATAAVLTLLEPIEIQVTADGQRIYSGLHQAGKVDIKFNKRAEIFVQDGSKARLKYSGWEHGALGQAGRKRRIVLNADTFASGRP